VEGGRVEILSRLQRKNKKEKLQFVEILLESLLSDDFKRISQNRELLIETVDEMYAILKDAVKRSKDERIIGAFESIVILRAMIEEDDISPPELLKRAKEGVEVVMGK